MPNGQSDVQGICNTTESFDDQVGTSSKQVIIRYERKLQFNCMYIWFAISCAIRITGEGGEAYGILHISLYYSGIELMITPNLYTSNYLPRSIY